MSSLGNLTSSSGILSRFDIRLSHTWNFRAGAGTCVVQGSRGCAEAAYALIVEGESYRKRQKPGWTGEEVSAGLETAV
jgi:hypothetical protein